MPGRKKSAATRGPGRFVSTGVVFLAWALTLMVGGAFGLASQKLCRAYRIERDGGRNSVSAVPYRLGVEEAGDRERKAAIIIDDLGPDLAVARGFWELPIPLTLAILPYRKYSREISRQALRHGKEVVLHLPMEPKGYPAVNPGPGSLLVSMDRERIQAEVAQQLDSLPECVGVSGYMGSLFTERPEPMRWALSVVAERGLFFVDSLTTPYSAARGVARELGVPFARRSRFLDGKKSEDAIVKQLCCLADSAVRDGGAIGIAHASAETLAALPKVVAGFADKGIRLVPVSEMITADSPPGAGRREAGMREPAPDG